MFACWEVPAQENRQVMELYYKLGMKSKGVKKVKFSALGRI